MKNKFILAPSILAANFSALGEDISIVEKNGAEYLHFDVMDGRFVPNISFGIPVLAGIKKCTKLFFDVHLMIYDPLKYIEAFAEAGADIINFHIETVSDIPSIIKAIKKTGKKAAVTLKPNTPIEKIYKWADVVDMILIMSVEPGFGGQKFIELSYERAESLANYINKNNLHTKIEMDGGIDLTNLRRVLNSGVNVVVAGSAIFKQKHEDTAEAVKKFLCI